jgi:hypothetical protein
LVPTVEVRTEVQAACSELRGRQEEAREANAARIHVEIVGDRPAAVSVLGESRVVGQVIIDAETAEPAEGQSILDLLAQTPFR